MMLTAFLLAKCSGFRSTGQGRKCGGVEEVSTESGIPGLHYIFDALVRFPSRSFPPAQLEGQVVHHVQFPTQINVTGAFGYVRSVKREWGIRDPSVQHEHRLDQIQLKTDASTCFVEFCQYSFRLADARCHQYDVISKAQTV
ncbi:hypothetical protein RB195_008942 [Necator americanus]|uniref:Uncharacterized protein n=1 Tax=Necator americanus TaxID=51031 RepID=A0ABR1CRT8_NECAM